MLKTDDCVWKNNGSFGAVRCIGVVVLCKYILARIPPLPIARNHTLFTEPTPPSGAFNIEKLVERYQIITIQIYGHAQAGKIVELVILEHSVP